MQPGAVQKLFSFHISYIDIYCILDHYAIVADKKSFIQIDKLNRQAYDAVFNDPDLGLKLSREAFNDSVPLKYSKGIAESKLQEGWCLLIKTNYEEALEALEESLKGFKDLNNDIGEMKALNAFGVLYSNISNYETAMDYHTKALDLSIKTNNNERLISAYINIGTLYAELEKYEEALDYYTRATKILEKTNNQEQLCVCIINIGDIHESQRIFNNALANDTVPGLAAAGALLVSKYIATPPLTKYLPDVTNQSSLKSNAVTLPAIPNAKASGVGKYELSLAVAPPVTSYVPPTSPLSSQYNSFESSHSPTSLTLYKSLGLNTILPVINVPSAIVSL